MMCPQMSVDILYWHLGGNSCLPPCSDLQTEASLRIYQTARAYIPIIFTGTAMRASDLMTFSYVPGILATVG
jgi:hypothetical protein